MGMIHVARSVDKTNPDESVRESWAVLFVHRNVVRVSFWLFFHSRSHHFSNNKTIREWLDVIFVSLRSDFNQLDSTPTIATSDRNLARCRTESFKMRQTQPLPSAKWIFNISSQIRIFTGEGLLVSLNSENSLICCHGSQFQYKTTRD
jgi:hypothetical protein